MLSYLKLIKIDNLILVALAQLCVKYGLFDPFGIDITLNGFGISLLIIATLCIAAAGNIIIELYEQPNTEAMQLQRNLVPEKSANVLFITLNVVGVLIGFYLANVVGKPPFAALFIIASGLFYLYASYLKEVFVLKNVIIALLASAVILLVGVFDLIPAITNRNRESHAVIFSILLDYSLFVFIIITLQELIKDCIHIDRDHNTGLRTVPIVLGKDRTTKLIAILSILPIVAAIYYIYTYLFSNTSAVILVLFLIVAPLLFFTVKAFGAENNKQLKLLLIILKVILYITSISLLFYQFLLK